MNADTRVFHVTKFGHTFTVYEYLKTKAVAVTFRPMWEDEQGEAYDDGRTYSGHAKLHPDDTDKYDVEAGIFLAMRRCLNSYYGRQIHLLKQRVSALQSEQADIDEVLTDHLEKYELERRFEQRCDCGSCGHGCQGE